MKQAHGNNLIRARLRRFSICVCIAVAIFALAGAAMNSLIVESVAYRSLNKFESPLAANVPYLSMYPRDAFPPEEATIKVFYRGYGNTFLRFTPLGSFGNGLSINGVYRAFPGKRNFWGGPLIVNLKPQLHPGENTVTIPIADGHIYESGIAVGPPLLGTNRVQSLCTLAFIASLLLLLWLFLAVRHDFITCSLFITACAAYVKAFNAMPAFSYTPDIEAHAVYLQGISDHFFQAYHYAQTVHPPTYYLLCDLIAKTLARLGVFDVWTGIQTVSLLSYIAFVYFGMLIMKRLFKGVAFYLATAILLFWPAGLAYLARTYNEAFFYPFSAACFYYTLVWYETNEANALMKSFIACGLGFLAKASALVPASIAGASILCKWASGRCSLQNFKNRETCIGALTVIIALALLANRYVYIHYARHFPVTIAWVIEGGEYNFPITLKNFLFTDPHASIWRRDIGDSLFSYVPFQHNYATALYRLYLAMLAYTFGFIFLSPFSKKITYFPLLAAILLSLTASGLFVVLGRILANGDFRYIWPVIIPIIATFMVSVQEMKRKYGGIFYYAGMAIAALFVILSVYSVYV